jgi:hypothetical protein
MRIANCITSRVGRRATVRVALSSCLLTSVICLLAANAPVNPDDPAYLRRQYAWFQAQDLARQQQLRKLHAEFQQLPPDEQSRLTRTLQTYNAWLARLPEPDRQRILSAPSTAERAELVRRLREQEWVDAQPKPYRDEYAGLPDAARREKAQEWRTEEADRREEWALAQKQWADHPLGKTPAAFVNDRPAIEAFVAHLRENLSEPERKSLDEARTALDEFGAWFGYGFLIVRLADHHPVYPWTKVGPREWQELPEEWKRQFPRPLDVPKEVRRTQGRWPEFAAELAAHARRTNVSLPPLGEAKKQQMPAEVVEFLDKALEPQLRRSADGGKADRKALADAEGKWPEYPRLVTELARKYKLTVPGWTLPGQPPFWDRLRAGKGKGR